MMQGAQAATAAGGSSDVLDFCEPISRGTI